MGEMADYTFGNRDYGMEEEKDPADYLDYTLVEDKKMSNDSQVVRFDDCFCSAETEKAILVVLPDNDEVWIPKSQIHDDSEVYKKDTSGDLLVSKWFADKEGFTGQGTVEFVGA